MVPAYCDQYQGALHGTRSWELSVVPASRGQYPRAVHGTKSREPYVVPAYWGRCLELSTVLPAGIVCGTNARVVPGTSA